jgi:hypothetical protein
MQMHTEPCAAGDSSGPVESVISGRTKRGNKISLTTLVTVGDR